MNRKQIVSLVEKSEALGYTRSTEFSSDLYHVVETLYRDPKGRLFLRLVHMTSGVGPDTFAWVDAERAIEFLAHDVNDCIHTDQSFTPAEARAKVLGQTATA